MKYYEVLCEELSRFTRGDTAGWAAETVLRYRGSILFLTTWWSEKEPCRLHKELTTESLLFWLQGEKSGCPRPAEAEDNRPEDFAPELLRHRRRVLSRLRQKYGLSPAGLEERFGLK